MIKRSLIILIASAMLLSMAARSNKTTVTDTPDDTAEVTTAATEQEPRFKIPEDAVQEVSVKKGLFRKKKNIMMINMPEGE